VAPADDGVRDFEIRLTLFGVPALLETCATFFALSSAGCLAVFVLAVPICFACLIFDDFTVFFADAITSALLFSFPAVETGRILTADMTSTDQSPREGAK
jgi:hypothetical protein